VKALKIIGLVAVLLGVGLLALSRCSQSTHEDVNAARACQATVVWSRDRTDANAQAMVVAADVLKGTTWQRLGVEIASLPAMLSNGDADGITAASDEIVALCGTIPAGAKGAGGYVQ
jgi:hypothetical protein